VTAPPPTRAFAFAAKFAGWCRACGLSFAKGTPVRYDEDDELVHAFGCPRVES
jgi:hypothetical protein